MTQSLNDFVSAVRLADSIEHERFLISSEQADLRTYIKDCEPSLRPRVVTKLVFLNIIGENVGYGAMEALSLMSADLFSYKRIGYMAAAVLLDETSELTVLITHTILKDLQSNDYRIQCLALACLANIGSAEMCQAVVGEVTRLFECGNSAVLKRIAMAATRIIDRVPELAEHFKHPVQKLLKHGSHGVVIAALNLMTHVICADTKMNKTWGRYATAFSKILKQLHQGKASREFSLSLFNDPFLQCRLMIVLAKLKKPSDDLDDVLESIATGVDIRKNTGRALLFQAVETIVATAKKPSLRALAFTQIGRLFQYAEPNVLYSALSVFSRVLYSGNEIIDRTSGDSIALQRYKTSVVQCLNHRDKSIRRRALDVVSALVDENNSETLIPEVLDYVKLADSEFRVEMIAKIYTAVQRFAPSPQWNFDIIHRILIENGNYVGTDLITSFCKLIMNDLELHQHAVEELATSLLNNCENQVLMQVTAFILGEYMIKDTFDAVDNLKRILSMPQTSNQTKGYIITALSKLAVRFGKSQEMIPFFNALQTSNNLDVQQRAGEMALLLENTELSEEVLMPLIQEETTDIVVHQDKNDGEELLIITNDAPRRPSSPVVKVPSVISDLLDIGATPVVVPPPVTEPKITPPPGAVEALRKPDYVIYFEIKKNPKDERQMAIRASVFNLGSIALNRFGLKFGVSIGWNVNVQPPSNTTLQPIGSPPILQQLFVYTQGNSPLMMKVQISYFYGAQPINEVGEINKIF